MKRNRKIGVQAAALSTTTHTTVRFSEVDSMQVVWHGEYVRYFEDGREAFGRQYSGLGYLDFYANGYTAPIVDLQLQYISPLTVNDIITRATPSANSKPTNSFIIPIPESSIYPKCTQKFFESPTPPETLYACRSCI